MLMQEERELVVEYGKKMSAARLSTGDAAGRADTEKAVAGRDDRHVDHQPVGFEHRNQRQYQYLQR